MSSRNTISSMQDSEKRSISKKDIRDELKKAWSRAEDDISTRGQLLEFLRKFWLEIHEQYTVTFEFNLLRSTFIIVSNSVNNSTILMRQDIKSEKLLFIVKDLGRLNQLPLAGFIKPSFKTARDALWETLREDKKKRFSYNELKHIFGCIKRRRPDIKTGIFDIIIHLVKHGFLITTKKDEEAENFNEEAGDNDNETGDDDEKTGNSEESDVKNLLLERLKSMKKIPIRSQERHVQCEEEAEYDIDFGDCEAGKEYVEQSISISTNKGDNSLETCQIIENDDEMFKFELISKEADRPNVESYGLKTSWCTQKIGYHKALLVLKCHNDSSLVFIGIKVHCLNKEMKQIAPIGPYKRFHSSYERYKAVIPGERPVSCDEWKSLIKEELNEYKVPSDLKQKVAGTELKDETIQAKLEEDLNVENYQEKFQNLLYIEEIQRTKDMRHYDMEDVQMRKDGEYLSLNVPGLAENRPSLMIGDRVIAKASNESVAYEGYIHHIEQEKIFLKFDVKYHWNFINRQKCHVSFQFNRFTSQLQHRAVEMAYRLLQEGKFSYLCLNKMTQAKIKASNLHKIRWFDKDIEGNQEQQNAVKNILSGASKPYPYIIFGPPGTGKTVTVVEAMKQVLSTNKSSYILACAPSNAAADLLLKRLLKYPPEEKKFFRLNATGRIFLSLPTELKPYCKFNETPKRFKIPSLEELMTYRVIVCTFVTAGRLVSMGMPTCHFTHVFMDESGQATEPETLIPLAKLLDPASGKGGQVVMAGDLKQLGPVLRSPIAIKNGLSVSLLERLMTTCSLYERKDSTYDKRYITKLINNYRSHEKILEVPNQLFYDGELKAVGDEMKTNFLCQWAGLPQKRFPIIFHGVLGKDEREEKSPSFFNRSEATIVMNYVRNLLEERSLGIKPSEIGIISPYKQQVKKLRQCLAAEKGKGDLRKEIRVGSVEEFQGTESPIIIISTVRSSEEYLKMDAEFKLGFLKNPKRFNVAITRAKALLIIVGNPFVLCKDEQWKTLVDFCIENGGYTGVQYKEDSYEGITGQLKDLNLADEDTITGTNIDAPWDRKEA